MDSALDVYKEMSRGTAQINPLSDYFQEPQDIMISASPAYEVKGISSGIHFRVPFSCEGKPPDVKDYGCDSEFKGDPYMEAEGIPEGYTESKYDYSTGMFFDYSTKK